MNTSALLLGVLMCLCFFNSSTAKPVLFPEEEESEEQEEIEYSQTNDEKAIGGVIDPHKLLKELFADRPLRFDKNGAVVWNGERQNPQSLKEIKKMRCFFNPISC